MEKFTGTVIVRANGKSLRSKEKAELDPGGYTRATVFADGGVRGYSEKPVESTITATLAHSSSTDLRELSDMVDATMLFETDGGQMYLVTGAFASRPAKLTGGEGDCSVEFKGPPAVLVS